MKTVVLVHGIRTRAWWQGSVSAILAAEAGCNVVPLKYGYFDLIRFLFPGQLFRRGPIDRVHQKLRTVIARYPDDDIVVIAHSFGTYAMANVLKTYSDIKIHGLILCGSIIHEDFPWDRIASQIKPAPARARAINECGTRDIWPPFGQAITWGYSATGTYGFGSADIQDRVHQMPHSGYFDNEFVRRYWVPFLKDGSIVASEYQASGAGTPAWFEIFNLPLRWIVAALLAVLVAWPASAQLFKLLQQPTIVAGSFACMADGKPLTNCSVQRAGEVFVLTFDGPEAAPGVLVDRYRGTMVSDGPTLIVNLSNEFNPKPGEGGLSDAGPPSDLRLSAEPSGYAGQWTFQQRTYRFAMSRKATQ
ncbi:hypothetical protein ASE11_09015 [Hydrogenophaga sp. Root209]|uniref:alpha/beta fold hydrolase n=1 Tax=Hydrogenophaga sp. Root209 TaxID=1736490 RepID=UPI0006F3D343|nr:alpha/beta hydrolase [Hydrogenophaga sp. Root209]KRB99802.1 hypothetical protein ASE11_09015 [Hydrogenophaga sp. Root209]